MLTVVYAEAFFSVHSLMYKFLATEGAYAAPSPPNSYLCLSIVPKRWGHTETYRKNSLDIKSPGEVELNKLVLQIKMSTYIKVCGKNLDVVLTDVKCKQSRSLKSF